MSNLCKTQRTSKESEKEMTLEKDFTLSEEELKIVREAIRKTMAEFLANQK
jgi:hypothetical protein